MTIVYSKWTATTEAGFKQALKRFENYTTSCIDLGFKVTFFGTDKAIINTGFTKEFLYIVRS